MADDPYRAPQARVDDQASAAGGKPEPKGLGGWLILIAIGLGVTMLRLVWFVVGMLVPIFTSGQWANLTTPGTADYHALWAPLLIFELCGNLLFVLMAGTLLVLFFRKSRLFPKVFIAYSLLNLAFVTGDYFLSDLIPAVAAANDADAVKEVARAVVGAAIWIPYMLVSKRVKNTFGAPPPVPAPTPA